jgi:hypothetical protein
MYCQICSLSPLQAVFAIRLLKSPLINTVISYTLLCSARIEISVCTLLSTSCVEVTVSSARHRLAE